MRRVALLLCLLMIASIFVPSSPAHVDNDSPLAIYLTHDDDLTYTLGSSVTVWMLVYWLGDYYDPQSTSFTAGGRSITPIRRAEGRYEATFIIQPTDLEDSANVYCWGWANDGPYPAPNVADSAIIQTRNVQLDFVFDDYTREFMAPDDTCEFELRCSVDGTLVDPDPGRLYVYGMLQGSTYKRTVIMTKQSTGIYTGTLQTPGFNTTANWHIFAEAEYTAPEGTLFGYNRQAVDVVLFPVWVNQVSVTTTSAVLELFVWEKDGWPNPDSIEGYPMQGALVNITYTYYDASAAKKIKYAQWGTGSTGMARFDLDYIDMGTLYTSVTVEGYVKVGGGSNTHTQKFNFFLPVRNRPHPTDYPGFDVELWNYYIPTDTTLTTIGNTARHDGVALRGQEIFVYIADDDFIYYSDSVLTDNSGYFNVQFKTPPLPEGEKWHVIDRCEYSTQVDGDWYMDVNWLYFGEANLYGEFNLTHDDNVTLTVNNLKDYQIVEVVLDHPDADGTEERALVTWAAGDPWNFWFNQLQLRNTAWAPVRHHWNVWPSHHNHFNYLPMEWSRGAWRATFYYPGFLPDSQEIFINGKIVFTDTLKAASATLKELNAADGKGWPTIDIDTPPTTGTHEGDVEVSGTAWDADGLTDVEIRIDGGAWFACSGTDDWSYMLDTSTMAYGQHSVEARANNGDHYSKVRTSTFWTDQRPTVFVVNPEDGGHYFGTLTVNGTAWDDLAVDAVQLMVDTGSWVDATGTTDWSHDLDLTGLTSGEHGLAVKSVAGPKESWATKIVFVVDRPPEVKITDPPSMAELAGVTHIKGEASDDLSLLEVHLRIDGGEWIPVSEESIWSYEIDTTTMTFGSHMVEARSYDGYGYSDIGKVSFTVNNPPTLPSINLEDGQSVSGVFRVEGTASDDDGVEKVQYQVDGGDWVDAEGTDDWYFDMDTAGMEPGTHNLRIRSYDGTSHSNDTVLTFNVNEPPEVTDISIETGEKVGGTVTITGTSSDEDDDVEGMQYRVDGGEWVDVDVDGNGDWDFDLDTTGLSHGTHTLEVRVGDGNQWSDPVSVEFFVDQVPEVTITSPATGGTVMEDFQVDGIASDDDTVDKVEVRIDEGAWTEATGTGTWDHIVAIASQFSGAHTLEARSYDGEQHSDIVSITFTIDRPPVVTITTEEIAKAFTKGFDVEGTASDDNAVVGLEFRLDDGEWEPLAGSQAWEYAIKVGDLEKGEHSLEVRAWDGVHYSDTLTYTFDIKEPEDESPGFVAAVSVLCLLVTSILMAASRRT